MALLLAPRPSVFPCPSIRPAPQQRSPSRRAPQYLHVVSSAAVCSGELLSYTQTAQPTQAPLSLEAPISVRATMHESELAQAAQLRAEAYHEARQLYGRFTQSFIKQFAAQELRNLLRRVQAGSGSCGGAPPTWLTLVAVEGEPAAALAGATAAAEQEPCSQEGPLHEQAQPQQHPQHLQSSYCQEWEPRQQLDRQHGQQQQQVQQHGHAKQQGNEGQTGAGRCIGTLDLRLATEEQLASFRSKKQWRELAPQPGVPVAYLSNVAVAVASRGRGVGRQLVHSAKLAAREALGAQWVLAHVQADNEPALQLYSKCGFVAVGEQEPTDGGILSSRLLLMSCRL